MQIKRKDKKETILLNELVLAKMLQVWYSHSRWHAVEGGGGPAAASAVLSKARGLLPDCLLLHFAAAELDESRGELDSARSIFEEQVQVLLLLTTLEGIA